MGTITVGGLATGLDTNSIVTQLVALERQRGIGQLQTQKTDASARQIAIQTFNSKVLTFLSAVKDLKTSDTLLAKQASSSNETVLTADAGTGALSGSTAITVDHLARPAIATSANGKTTATATIATGSGNFAFRIGTGAVKTIAIDATTTLSGLASAINALGAGVTASVLNVGSSGSPDYRLRISSDQTGVASAVSVVTDDTTLGVAVTQSALDASFTVSGFSDPFTRDTNTVGDVIPGVTLNLLSSGTTTVTVGNDADAIAGKLDAAVKAFNDIVTFVDQESVVSQDPTSDDKTVSIGPLALDSTVRGIVDSLHQIISGQVQGTSDTYTVAAQVGITTTREGTLAFDQATFRAQLGAHGNDVAALFAGKGTTGGLADKLSDYLTGITQAGGIIAVHATAVGQEISTLDDRLAAGQRNLDAFEENLRAQFTSLEVLVQSLKSQGSFLLSALANTGSSS